MSVQAAQSFLKLVLKHHGYKYNIKSKVGMNDGIHFIKNLV